MEVRFFNANLERFIYTLQKPTISKVLRAIDLIQQFGHHLRMPLHGFLKKSQRIPKKELEIARQKLSTLDTI